MGKRIELAAIAALIAGLILYAELGLSLAGSRVAAAEHAVDSAVSHQNTLNAAFGDINSHLTALGANGKFDSAQTLALVDRSVANADLAAKTVSADEASLRDADSNLHAQPWLTMVNGSSVAHAATRVRHARDALAIAHTLATDQAQDGRFWQALYGSLADLEAVNKQHDAGNVAAARAAQGQMKVDVDHAAELSSSPGLPAEMAALAADLQKLAADYGRQLDAEAANNYDGASLIATDVSADMSRIGSYDVDRVGAEITAYFQPAIDRYNAEIRAAGA